MDCFQKDHLKILFQTTLCYILFSYHLKLGHNDEAYDAMVSNPDQSRRKDSLRQFIVTLFDRRQLKQVGWLARSLFNTPSMSLIKLMKYMLKNNL